MEGLPYETIGRVAVYVGVVLLTLLMLAGIALQVFFYINDRKLFWSFWLRHIALSLVAIPQIGAVQVVIRGG